MYLNTLLVISVLEQTNVNKAYLNGVDLMARKFTGLSNVSFTAL